MAHDVTLIPGDGAGPEISHASRRVLDATGVAFSWDVQQAGAEAARVIGTPLPPETIASIRRTGVALKGPTGAPAGNGVHSVDATVRRELGLYARLHVYRSYRGATGRDGIDLVTVCENREALDSGIPDAATWRLAHVALQYARDNRRKRVTVVTGARGEAQVESNRLGSLREAAEDFPEIELAELAVDDARGQLIQRPERFDVVLLRSPHGDQLLDLCAGLVGGPGLVPGASIGGEAALFEPAHGAGPEHGGLNRANPLAMMLCGVLLLRHLEEHEAAGRLERAIADVIAEGKMLTYDMKSDRHDTNAVGTSQVADGVVAKLLTVKAAA